MKPKRKKWKFEISSYKKFYITLRDIIYLERVKCWYTQAQVANHLKISTNLYCKKENWKRKFNNFELYRLCKLFNIKLLKL